MTLTDAPAATTAQAAGWVPTPVPQPGFLRQHVGGAGFVALAISLGAWLAHGGALWATLAVLSYAGLAAVGIAELTRVPE